MSDESTFTILGQQTTGPSRELETVPAPDCSLVTFTSHELTSFCPVTGQPDFYTVVIEYNPSTLCVESKSLKLYLWSFREESLFAERLAARIAADLAHALVPMRVKVTLHQNVRGGLQLSATSELSREDIELAETIAKLEASVRKPEDIVQ